MLNYDVDILKGFVQVGKMISNYKSIIIRNQVYKPKEAEISNYKSIINKRPSVELGFNPIARERVTTTRETVSISVL